MKEYVIKSGLLDRERKLVLTEDYLEWENKDLKGDEFTRLNKSDYLDFKHGVDWIVWYKFTLGRKFSIAFKDKRIENLRSSLIRTLANAMKTDKSIPTSLATYGACIIQMSSIYFSTGFITTDKLKSRE